jgi:hypothetical protein
MLLRLRPSMVVLLHAVTWTCFLFGCGRLAAGYVVNKTIGGTAGLNGRRSSAHIIKEHLKSMLWILVVQVKSGSPSASAADVRASGPVDVASWQA